VNPEKQLFYCFGCGVGGDVFTFVARVERTDFRGAALRLAAKVGMTIDAISPEERERQRRESARERILAQTLKDRAAKVLLDTREYLHWLLSVRRNAAKRLTAIHNCGPIEGQDEVEWQWEKLRLLANEIRHAYAAYMIAALADHAGRYSYALHPERRAEMIDAALEFGFVRGAKRGEFGGILFEVDA
jgi:DNA primase